MSGYWETVPKGTWTVVDPDDALLAVQDRESRSIHVTSLNDDRIHVYGPAGKALILDLLKISESLGPVDFKDFKNKLARYLPL